MEEVGRNDSCPCGSGKKYKKCHGSSNVIVFSPEPYNSKLDILQDELLDFAIEYYKPELAEIFDDYPQPGLMEDKELLNLYLLGLTNWAIFTKPFANDQTIFEIFYQRNHKKIRHKRVRKAFAAWSETTPRLYETLSVSKEWVFLQDIHSKEEYKVATLENYYFENDFVFGMLVPFVDHYEFMEPSLEIAPEEEALRELFNERKPAEFLKNYPDYLAAFFIDEEDMAFDWEQPIYGVVAELFINQLYEKGAAEELVVAGVYFWRIFIEKEQPIIKKPNGYAAALEYVLQSYVDGGIVPTQKELAKEYETSVSALSKNAAKLEAVIDDAVKSAATDLFSEE